MLFPSSSTAGVTDTITATATKFTILEQTSATDHNDIVLWIDPKDGTMLQETIGGSKLPNIGGTLSQASSIISGAVNTKLELTAKSGM